jgi:PAS domain S-box-containing protein
MHLLNEIRIAGNYLDSCFVVADMSAPGFPAIYVNAAFEKYTGYTADQVLGRNLRFLQGPLSSPTAVQSLRLAIGRREGVHQDIINYKRNGQPFWNRMVLVPFMEGSKLYYFGFQHDVTEKKNRIIGQSVNTLSRRLAQHHEICHHIRNPLSTVLNVRTIIERSNDEATRLFTNHLANAVQRITDYVMQLPWSGDAERPSV